MLPEQERVQEQLRAIFNIFMHAEGEVRPHFIITGPSGSGKSHTVEHLANEYGLAFLEINAAQLTKEGTAGNSLSKALAPLGQLGGRLAVCFVDEFDKLFISGNHNSALAHETTNGVQNEFLRVLEAKTTSVFGDYGKYHQVDVSKVLFVFAGAFNGEEGLTIDRLRDFGIKTEFLGRVGLLYSLPKLGLESMRIALEQSALLARYMNLFANVDRDHVIQTCMRAIEDAHEQNTLGLRLVNTLLHQYFINGGALEDAQVKTSTFQKKLFLPNGALPCTESVNAA